MGGVAQDPDFPGVWPEDEDLHSRCSRASKLQSLEGQEEAQDQLQGGTLQLRRVHYSDLVSYQCTARSICSLIPVPLIYHQLGNWA